MAESSREFYYESSKWFEVTHVAERVWAIREPHHYEDVFSYFIKGDTASVLIDTGMGLSDIRRALPEEEQPLVLLTHTHWDHVGSAVDFNKVKVPDHPFETERLRRGWQPEEMVGFESENFADGYKSQEDLSQTFTIPGKEDALPLSDGEIIDLGGITIRAIMTPGHTPGSTSYFIPELGYLFTGDTLYPGPEYLHMKESNPTDCEASLAKLLTATKENLQIIFPGHNASTASPDLLKRHYDAMQGLLPVESEKEGEDEFGKYRFLSFGDFQLMLPRD